MQEKVQKERAGGGKGAREGAERKNEEGKVQGEEGEKVQVQD